jgi:hypothetical protein
MTQQSADRRGGRIGSLVLCAVLSLLSVWLIGSAAYYVWAQHSGTTASVEVVKCWPPNNFTFPAEFTSFGRRGRASRTADCTAVWRPADGAEQTVTVKGVPHHYKRVQQGDTFEVNIHDHRAYTDSMWLPVPDLLFGALSAGLALLLGWRGRRRRQRRTL